MNDAMREVRDTIARICPATSRVPWWVYQWAEEEDYDLDTFRDWLLDNGLIFIVDKED